MPSQLGLYPGSLREHHERVMVQSRRLPAPAALSRELFDLVLGLHDVGKRQSMARSVGYDSQHELTTAQLDFMRSQLPIDDVAFERMKGLVNGDPLGAMARGRKSPEEAAAEVLYMAQRAQMSDDVPGFLELLIAYHQADFAAYTTHGGGHAMLDHQFELGAGNHFIKHPGGKRWRYSQENEAKLSALSAALDQLAQRNRLRPLDSVGDQTVRVHAADDFMRERLGATDTVTLFHVTDTPWAPPGKRAAIDLFLGGGKFGTGFYTANEALPIYGANTFKLTLPVSAFKGKRILEAADGWYDDRLQRPKGVDLVATKPSTLNTHYVIFKPEAAAWLNHSALDASFVTEPASGAIDVFEPAAKVQTGPALRTPNVQAS